MHKVLVTLNQMYKTAIGIKLAYENPCMFVTLQKEPPPERTPIPENIIPVLIDFCKGYEDGVLILTLLYTGMRRGEIVALCGEDIDWDRNCFTVNKAVEFINNKPHIKSPKTKSGYRTIPILNVLHPYKDYFLQIGKGEPVFKNAYGDMHTLTSIRRLFDRFNQNYNAYAKRINQNLCHTFTMHEFRHTYATMLYKADVDIKTAQSFLGHSSVAVTMDIYTHLDQTHKEVNAEKLNKFLGAQASIINGSIQSNLVKI